MLTGEDALQLSSMLHDLKHAPAKIKKLHQLIQPI